MQDSMAFVSSFTGNVVRGGGGSSRRSASPSVRRVTTMVAAESTARPSKFEEMRRKFGVATSAPDAGFSYDDFASAVDNYQYSMREGDTVSGQVFDCSSRGAMVDIGAKAAAWLPSEEFSPAMPDAPAEFFAPDTSCEFVITAPEDANGQLKLSLRRLAFQRNWERILQLQSEDVPVLSEFISSNRGGCLVKVEGLRGFIPQSHATALDIEHTAEGHVVAVKFLEVEPEKNRIVLSHKLARATNEMVSFSPGDVVTGAISGVKPYGAFVDVNGVSGLLHISQISHDHVADVSALLKPGMMVKCMILNQDRHKGRMSLSTKVLEPEPGDMVRDSQKVFDNADDVARRYKEKLEEERRASAEVAEEIVSALDFARVDDMAPIS